MNSLLRESRQAQALDKALQVLRVAFQDEICLAQVERVVEAIMRVNQHRPADAFKPLLRPA